MRATLSGFHLACKSTGNSERTILVTGAQKSSEASALHAIGSSKQQPRSCLLHPTSRSVRLITPQPAKHLPLSTLSRQLYPSTLMQEHANETRNELTSENGKYDYDSVVALRWWSVPSSSACGESTAHAFCGNFLVCQTIDGGSFFEGLNTVYLPRYYRGNLLPRFTTVSSYHTMYRLGSRTISRKPWCIYHIQLCTARFS